MSSFSDRLAAAKAAPRPYEDVEVLLDVDLSERRAVLQERVAGLRSAAQNDQRLAAPNPEMDEAQAELDALLVESSDALVTLRFTRMPGDEWAEITARCPVRLDAPIDRQYGFNMHAVCKLAAPLSGVRIEDDTHVPLEVEEWADLFSTISGHEFGLIIDAIYSLNEYEPATRVAQLKKGLATHPA